MEHVKTGLAGRILWGAAAVLLLVVWLASMPLDDDRLCNAVPVCFGLVAVLVLGVMGMVAGARPARLTPTSLLGLAAGVYFLARCAMGDMLSEICRELPLIFIAFVFYGAGYLLAQRRGGGALTLALVVGVVVNIIYLFLMRDPATPIEAMGRPSMSLAGVNRQGITLFTYSNFSAIFLMVSGGVLICRPLWAGWRGWGGLLAALVGMAGVACSCLCDSRSVLGLPVLMLLSACGLWAIIGLYSGRGIGWGVVCFGLALLVGAAVMLGELFMGNSLLQTIISVDTNGRAGLWSEIYRILPQTPWYGHGAGGTTWQLVPLIDRWAIPNYAHNDYLQAWVDYGIVGVVLLVLVLLSHLASGFWSMASEDIAPGRRTLLAACMLLLLSLAACAVYEFVWHNMAFVGLTAFACGVLASPVPSRQESWLKRRKWAAGSRPALRPVRFLGLPGTALCCMGAVTLAAACACFAWRLLPAWKAQWEYNALCHAGASDGERVEFLERVMPFYPDPELADHYVTLCPPAERRDNLARKEAVLRMARQSNPHQLFTVVMLAELLGYEGHCAEAEALMREHYVSGGMPPARYANWPAYYGMNLLMWGKQRMEQGELGSALSMMEYALNLWGHAEKFHHKRSVVSRIKSSSAYVAARRVDVDMLRLIGVEKDDSWMQPLRPDGPPALYARWGSEPHSVKYSNPYARSSPLKY